MSATDTVSPQVPDEVLASFPRGQRAAGGRARHEEIRVSISAFTGTDGKVRRFLSMRVWSRGPDGIYRATSKGVAFKPNEVETLARAVHLASMTLPSRRNRR